MMIFILRGSARYEARVHIRHRKHAFQITLYHDFKRVKGAASSSLCCPTGVENIERARSRTKYLREKLKALNGASNRLPIREVW